MMMVMTMMRMETCKAQLFPKDDAHSTQLQNVATVGEDDDDDDDDGDL
jgi:hypothetical protein